MSLKIYNTLCRKKRDFKSIDEMKVRMYVCGPTVYNFVSIGNSRPLVVFNMVRNYLEHLGYKVDYVSNITDIEDKIIKKANEENVDFNVITEKYIEAYLEDLAGLEIGGFSAIPKASELIPEIILIISRIIENGYGYESAGDVYFDVSELKDYGKLSGQKIEEMKASEEDTFSKRSPIDFTLWKRAKPGEPFWDSPWGNGRPGWHIECSAMAIKYLDYGLDIHGGGIDLVFPHHENEIAQSESAFPDRGDFVNYWMHNGMIEVKEEKMSKSKGLKSDWILRNILKKYSANVIKFYMLSTHYRSPLEFSPGKLEESRKALEKITNFLRNLKFLAGADSVGNGQYDNLEPDNISAEIYSNIRKFKSGFRSSMDDDFNSAKAIGDMFDIIKSTNTVIQNSGFRISTPINESLKMVFRVINEYGRILGFNLEKELSISKQILKGPVLLEEAEIEELIEQRNNARKNNDFNKADEIRQKLKNYGIILDDRKEGTLWKRES